ncbi:MAG: Nif3-like dinuclear metal center hexameric protein [Phaeodactylibacter sp.]|uniref:Nif3-like dinuclear metal center hexameric protein n=1 Tax=Phaeodactylibacter sp. TaxID=1940289 RepID=UPI0032ECF9C4
MQIRDVIQHLEQIAPPVYQAGYDNAGLITGDDSAEVKGVLCCLDSTEAIVAEAIEKGCNLIVAHHPIVFKGLKSLTGRNYVERVVIQAIRHDIAIYAIHTNLDSVYYQGVNTRIAEKLKLQDTRILAPAGVMKKLSVYVPPAYSDTVRKALFAAGAGTLSQEEALSYASLGVGTQRGQTVAEVKLEVFFATGQQPAVLRALRDSVPEQQLPYEVMAIENKSPLVGSGMIGRLEKPMKEDAFLKHLKKAMDVSVIRHTALLGQPVRTVAVCGGAGGFLLGAAKGQGADIFITADYKYHEFFDADGQIVIADIGHYESEQFTIQLLQEIISQKFSNFAAYCTEVTTNPVHYL